MPFTKDPDHWLFKFSPAEWLSAAQGELSRAEAALAQRNARAAIFGCKRAAGMALNGALIVSPNEAWGRTYVEHVAALSNDEGVPEAVREAARGVRDAQPPSGGGVVLLRTPSSDEHVLESTRDVIAHAYAVIKRHESD